MSPLSHRDRRPCLNRSHNRNRYVHTAIDLKEDDKVGMSEQLDDADLARQELVEVLVGRVALGDDLDGDFGLVTVGVGQLHRRERALPELLRHVVAVLFQDWMAGLVIGSGSRHDPRRRRRPRRVYETYKYVQGRRSHTIIGGT